MAESTWRRVRSVSLRVLAIVAVALAGVLAAVVATGWLYLWQSRLPGPRLNDALPLDELPGHAWAPAIAFIPVWMAIGMLLGLICRWVKMGRMTAAIELGVVVAAVTFANTAISIWIVRQIPGPLAIHAATHVRAVPLAAALCAVGGALMALPGARRGPTASTRLIAAFVVGIGLIDLALPLIRTHVGLGPVPTSMLVPPVSAALAPAIGLMLVVLGRGLARGRHDALLATIALVTVSAELQILTRVDRGVAALNLFVLAVLLARRHEFTGRGDPDLRMRLAVKAALVLSLIVCYGVVALWINRSAADQSMTLAFALSQVFQAMLGANIDGSAHLAGSFGRIFPLSMALLTAAAGILLLREWLAPWRYRLASPEASADTARALVATYGSDTLAPFTLRQDKSYFVGRSGEAFIAYRVVARVAVISGDPVGTPDGVMSVFDEFVDFAHERGWRVAMLGASDRHIDHYRSHGFRALHHGNEALIDVMSFSLEGRSIRKVRQSTHRLDRAGYTTSVRTAGECTAAVREEMRTVVEGFLDGQPLRGFTMELDELFRLDGDDALFVIGFDPEGRIAGFLHFAVLHAATMLSLSSMPRLPSTPNGFNEWLIVNAIEWSRARGITRLSMNFAPFSSLLDPAAELNLWQKAERRTLVSLKGRFQLDSLYRFNSKFTPTWQARYLVYETPIDLPRVGIATLAAEAYITPRLARS